MVLPARIVPTTPGARVSRLELFYDLIFVFAFLHVTDVTAEHLGPVALVYSLLLLALLWLAWTSFAVLGNVVRADLGVMPLFGFAIIAAVFGASVTLSRAFEDNQPGLPGDLIFASCYFLVRALQVAAGQYVVWNNPRLRRRWQVLGLPPLLTTALLFVAALVPQQLLDGRAQIAARIGLWLLAIVVAYLADTFIRTEGLQVVSATHWAERHSHIILIALGESIISLGTGASLRPGLPITWTNLLAAGFGIALIVALWWMYFDSVVLAAERALLRVEGDERVLLARRAYTYLHFPIVAGIILLALGLRRALDKIADTTVPGLQEALGRLDLLVLYGGVILYLLAHLGFQWLTVRACDRLQPVAILLLAALIPVAMRVPAFAALVMLVLIIDLLAAGLSWRNKQSRLQLRQEVLEEEQAVEAREAQIRRRRFTGE